MDKEKVIAIMPDGTVAQFDSWHIAKAMLLKKYHNNIYRSSDDIYNTMSHNAIISWIGKYYQRENEEGIPPKPVPLDARADASVASTILWALMHEYADQIYSHDKKGRLVRTLRKVDATEVDNDPFKLTAYWLLYRPGEDPIMDGAFLKLPPQAQACVQVLIDATDMEVKAGRDVVMSEATLFKYIERDKLYIRTRQSKWRIFKYYRSALIARNFMRMRG